MATFLEIRTALEKRLHRDNDQVIMDAIPDEINRAINYFSADRFEFNQEVASFALEADEEDITTNPSYPTDVKYIDEENGLVIEQGNVKYPINKISNYDYDTVSALQTSGRPYMYTQREGKVLIYPYPQDTYNVNLTYYKAYPDLVNDGDSNDFTNNARDLIINRVLEKIYREYAIDENRAAVARGAWKEEHNQLTKLAGHRLGTGLIKSDRGRGGLPYNYRRGRYA